MGAHPESSLSASAALPGEGSLGVREGPVLPLDVASCPLWEAAWALPTGGC